MSHFTVLCITMTGDAGELEKLLGPYDENDNLTEFEPDEDCEGGGYWHNPMAKWDWWVVGGRWSNRLRRKDGTMVDACAKGDLDIVGMRLDAAAEAGGRWDKMTAAFAGFPSYVPWATVRDEMHPGDINAARATYNAQPHVAKLGDVLGIDYVWDSDKYLTSWTKGREHVCMDAARRAIPGFATCTPEGWQEPGEMGWFAMDTSTEETRDRYYKGINAFIDALPDTAWLTMVDCHI